MPAPSTESRSHQSGQPDAELLQAVLDRTGITTWDILVVGDGSGSTWDRACGWASVLVDRESRGRRAFYGAMNLGSVNFAESMPYLQALNWYDANVGKARLKQQDHINVHIITDSQVVAQWGVSAQNQPHPPRKHLPVWAGMRAYYELGYRCTWHWAPRMTTQFNWLADCIAGLSRRGLEAYDQEAHDLRQRAITALAQTRFVIPGTDVPLDPYMWNEDAS